MTTTTTSSEAPDRGGPPEPAALRELAASLPAQTPQQRNIVLGFDRIVDDWENREAQQKFVYEASQANELAFAGKLYRAVLERWPEDAMALAAQKQIATSAMFAGQLGQGTAGPAPKFPRWVFLSGGMSLAWIIMDLTTEGTFSPVDLLMVLICFGSIGFAIYKVRG